MANHPAPAPARTPTQEEVLDERELAFRINKAFTEAIARTRDEMWAVARWAYEADEELIWIHLGFETKGEWLSQPDIHMTRSTFDRMVRVWRETVVTRHLDAPTLEHLDVSKVDIVLPRVNKHEITIQEAISDVESMGAIDLREKYQPRARPEPEPEPEVFDSEVLSDTSIDTEEPPPEDDPEYEPEDYESNGQPEPFVDRYLAVELAQVMWRISEEVAPAEKKRMTNELREEIKRVLSMAIEGGLLDV